MVRPRPTPPVDGLREAIEPDERSEHPVAIGRRDARSVVVDEDIDPVRERLRPDSQIRAVAAGIGDQIGETAPQGVAAEPA